MIYYRNLKKGWKYQIQKDFVYQIPKHLRPVLDGPISTPYISLGLAGEFRLKKGYCSDGPSGPTVDTKAFMRGAFVHDGLYQLIRQGHLPRYYKDTADLILKLICLADGMWKVRAWWVFKAVQAGGWLFIRPKKPPVTLTAP